MEFSNSEPIYQQIIDIFKKQLIRGELHTGDKIPSQREFAEKVRVNPNTVQRAYREMESMQMVETIRGQGTFIRASEEMQTMIKKEMAANILQYFVQEMRSLGYKNTEMLNILTHEFEQDGKEDNNDRV
ncbi:MAG: GntR family transcriptional regulator [Syntrophomonas sp.]|nr:GntR family transcriptional regulator [Syntrophomonas sp.]